MTFFPSFLAIELNPDYSFTSGIPVTGNLTILATIEPAKPIGRVLDTYPAIEQTFKVVSESLSPTELEKYKGKARD